MEMQGRPAKNRKRSTEMLDKADRISSLPDGLCLHILSFLEMQYAVNTSVLSSRWKYLWTSISCLDFGIGNWEHKTDKVTFINCSLFNFRGPKLRKLRICYLYENTDDATVESWIYFAVRHNVEELVLHLYNGRVAPKNKWSGKCYKLPQSLYSCSSLKSWALSFCDLNMPVSIHFDSLRKLALASLDLSAETITLLTSNCPLLEDMTLSCCNMYSDLNIVITNKKLKSLTIFDYQKANTRTEIIICAPYVHVLNYQHEFWRGKYGIRNMQSLLKLNIVGKRHGGDHLRIYCKKDADHVSVLLLRDLYFVVKMYLSMFVIQILSIREVQGIHPSFFNATNLQLETELTKWELPGISYLLKSSPKLQSLTIRVPGSIKEIKLAEDFKNEFAFEEQDYWKTEYCFSSGLQNLEFVNICFLSSAQKYSSLEEDLKNLRNKIEFAQFLLKNSVGLKKMIIKCGNDIHANSELLRKLREELVLPCRASSGSTVDII